ncbi:MAG: glycoside hydrolase family 3 N-terminal domain-containing protein [Chitinophagaceae bacterium]
MTKFLLPIPLILLMLMTSSFKKQHPVPHSTYPTTMHPDKAARRWVDSVFKSLTDEQKIAQLIMIRAHSNLGPEHIAEVTREVRDLGVGGLLFFQGGPVRQAELTNFYQSISKVPLLVGTDAEWGLGMRLDSVISFPFQLTLGALPESSTLVYDMGKAIGEQCKRMNIQIDFAPVVDVNSNPNNPVIGIRSFGENKYRVAQFGIAYMKGLQDQGIMACAKHFPGHGDADVDSHLDLPEIHKTIKQLDSLELYPFKQMFRAGVSAVMVAHLFIPGIDSTPHLPTSLSYKNVTRLLKRHLGFKGLVFTDALEMKGVTKYFSGGAASVKALEAGNDMILLPENVDSAIAAINEAIKEGKIHWRQINKKVRKVLMAKYEAGLGHLVPIDTTHLVADLNSHTLQIKKQIYDQAITVLSNENRLLPLNTSGSQRIAYLGVGLDKGNGFDQVIGTQRKIDDYYFPVNGSTADRLALAATLESQYDVVIIGVHHFNLYPAGNFGLSEEELLLIHQLQLATRTITVVFGNPYAIRNFCGAPTLVAAYEDDPQMHQAAADLLFGKIIPQGKLPVTVCHNYPYGAGLTQLRIPTSRLPETDPQSEGMNPGILDRIDSIANNAIAQGATPGCVVLAARNGKIVYKKAFGYFTYDQLQPVRTNTIYDMASCTKIAATTMAVMRLYDQGKIKLDKTLGDYLPWLKGTDKAGLVIKDVLLHQAGLIAYIPFYQSLLYPNGHPDSVIFHSFMDAHHTVRVAAHLYMDPDYLDTMNIRIAQSKLGPPHHYVYSDNDFILMGKIVHQLTGQTLDHYVKTTFYDPLGMTSSGFKPRQLFPLDRIAPTECEKNFRLQCLHGDVHDPGAAMFGGVAGHAGLFSDVNDLAVLMQTLLDGGTRQGVSYIQPSTIKLFTAYHSDISRRGYGFDKPQRHRENELYPYPAKSCSAETFGHLGYTGTAIWVDPKYQLIFIFLSNRVNPNGGSDLKLSQMNVRGNILQTLYDAMGH